MVLSIPPAREPNCDAGHRNPAESVAGYAGLGYTSPAPRPEGPRIANGQSPAHATSKRNRLTLWKRQFLAEKVTLVTDATI